MIPLSEKMKPTKEKIIAIHIFENRLVSRTYKELLKVNIKNKQLAFKMGRGYE